MRTLAPSVVHGRQTHQRSGRCPRPESAYLRDEALQARADYLARDCHRPEKGRRSGLVRHGARIRRAGGGLSLEPRAQVAWIEGWSAQQVNMPQTDRIVANRREATATGRHGHDRDVVMMIAKHDFSAALQI